MSKGLVRRSGSEMFQPQTLAELQSIADVISKSGCIPQRYIGKAGDIIVAGMTGRELGMGLMQSLQAIYVVHGTPGVLVEHAIGIVRASGKCEFLTCTIDRTKMVATCKTKRTDEKIEHTYTFSKEDAAQAGYLGKGGSWKERDYWMLQVRATGQCLKHVYPDVTHGLQLAEMVQEYHSTHPDAPTLADLTPAPVGAPVAPPPAPEPLLIPEVIHPEVFSAPQEAVLTRSEPTPAPATSVAPPVALPTPAPAPLPKEATAQEIGQGDQPNPGAMVPDWWSGEMTQVITAPMSKRLYAKCMAKGMTKPQMGELIKKWGYDHSNQILSGHYAEICNAIEPGSTEDKFASVRQGR